MTGGPTTSSSARVLVTGACGYVGSATTRALSAAGVPVVAVDVRPPSNGGLLGNAMFVRADVRDSRAMREVMHRHGVDAVVHIAGLKSVPESLSHPERYFDTNFNGSLSILTAMAEIGVRFFVFSSSAAVYGTATLLPISEEAAVRPLNPYGESKVLVERALPWFRSSHGIEYIILRYFNAAGAATEGRFGEDWTNAVNLIPVAIRAALTGTPVEVFGRDFPTPDGTAIRDYVHVDDLADAHWAALRHLADGGPSDVINLGTGRGASVAEVIDAIQQRAEGTLKVLDAPRRPGDPAAAWADIERANRVLGWTPSHDLQSIVDTAWRWHERQAVNQGTAR